MDAAGGRHRPQPFSRSSVTPHSAQSSSRGLPGQSATIPAGDGAVLCIFFKILLLSPSFVFDLLVENRLVSRTSSTLHFATCAIFVSQTRLIASRLPRLLTLRTGSFGVLAKNWQSGIVPEVFRSRYVYVFSLSCEFAVNLWAQIFSTWRSPFSDFPFLSPTHALSLSGRAFLPFFAFEDASK